jgi:VWFA-related protein
VTRVSARLFTALLPFVIAMAPAPPQQPTFSVKTDAVRLDVSVMRGGQPVAGLQASDFVVLDNGVAQTIELVSFEQLPLDVAFALDTSGSVSGDRLRHLTEATAAVLDGLRKGDRAGLLVFNHAVHLRVQFTESFDRIREVPRPAEPAGLTSLFDAGYASLTLARVGGIERRATVILFSDGNDTASWLSAAAVLDAARRADVSVYAVRSAAEIDTKFLDDITAATGGRLLRATDRNLRSSFLEILEELKHRYLLSYYPRGTDAKGWHAVTARLKSGGGQVKARPGYFR